MKEYAEIRVNMAKYVWMVFVSLFPISPFVLNPFSTWTRGNLFKRLQKTRVYDLKEHEVGFWEWQNSIFYTAAEVFHLFLVSG